MTRLTVNLDDAVAARVKRQAKQRGVSVSKVIEGYLASLTPNQNTDSHTPILDSLTGILKGADPEDYHRYLEAKYLK